VSAEIAIDIDDEAVEKHGAALDKKVTISLRQPISLLSALTLLLSPELTFDVTRTGVVVKPDQ
jgi:hypothetical protein